MTSARLRGVTPYTVNTPMGRDSLPLLGLGLIAAIVGGFLAFWLLLKIWFAFGFLAVAAILLAFAWWYDRREKRARAGLPRV
jgi:membrane protein implicated in regulation of membrane protease activity